MKDRIVASIHRQRAKYAKRFAYDVGAIGNAIRRSQMESGEKFVTRRTQRPKTVRRRTVACK
jgi:hypothetical protein